MSIMAMIKSMEPGLKIGIRIDFQSVLSDIFVN